MTTSLPYLRAIPTPCTGVCTLDGEGCCLGCQRSTGEIAGWMDMDDAERLRLMDVVLPAREALRR